MFFGKTLTCIIVAYKLPQIEINDRRVDKKKIFYKQQMPLKIILNSIINKSGGGQIVRTVATKTIIIAIPC